MLHRHAAMPLLMSCPGVSCHMPRPYDCIPTYLGKVKVGNQCGLLRTVGLRISGSSSKLGTSKQGPITKQAPYLQGAGGTRIKIMKKNIWRFCFKLESHLPKDRVIIIRYNNYHDNNHNNNHKLLFSPDVMLEYRPCGYKWQNSAIYAISSYFIWKNKLYSTPYILVHVP